MTVALRAEIVDVNQVSRANAELFVLPSATHRSEARDTNGSNPAHGHAKTEGHSYPMRRGFRSVFSLRRGFVIEPLPH